MKTDNTITNIFITIMLVTVLVGYDVAHSPTPIAKAQEVVEPTPTPTPTTELTTEAHSPIVEKKYVRPTTCQGAIEEVFGELAPQAERVSFCESSFNPQAKHTNSSAKGCFQIINGTWKTFKCSGDPLDALDNTKCAKKIYDYYGSFGTSGGWKASAHCHKQK